MCNCTATDQNDKYLVTALLSDNLTTEVLDAHTHFSENPNYRDDILNNFVIENVVSIIFLSKTFSGSQPSFNEFIVQAKETLGAGHLIWHKKKLIIPTLKLGKT